MYRPTERTIKLEAEHSNTIEDVKKKIQSKTGIPPGYQLLTFRGYSLRNELTLGEYGFKKKSTFNLHLVSRSIGWYNYLLFQSQNNCNYRQVKHIKYL